MNSVRQPVHIRSTSALDLGEGEAAIEAGQAGDSSELSPNSSAIVGISDLVGMLVCSCEMLTWANAASALTFAHAS